MAGVGCWRWKGETTQAWSKLLLVAATDGAAAWSTGAEEVAFFEGDVSGVGDGVLQRGCGG
jgi:hypothetical protein